MSQTTPASGPDLGTLLSILSGSASGGGMPAWGNPGQPLDMPTLLSTLPTSAVNGNISPLSQVASNLGGDTISGGNENQMQEGQQAGTYTTAENTAQQQAQASQQLAQALSQLYAQNNQQSSGTSSSTGLTGTTGSTVSAPVDTLGMGAMLSSQIAPAEAITSGTQNQLAKMATYGYGAPALQDQMNKAVSDALSGPGMTGVGDAARSRAVGTAARDIGMNNANLELNAISALNGPNAEQALATAANPYIGSATANTGTQATQNSGTTSNNTMGSSTQMGSNSSNTIGANLGSTIGAQTAGGTAAGQTASIAAGTVPQSSSSGGGSYVCTAMVHLGKLGRRSVRSVVAWKLYKRKDLDMALGYSIFGPFLARLVLSKPLVRRLMLPIVRSVLYDELRQMGRLKRFRPTAWASHLLFHLASTALGKIAKGRVPLNTLDLEVANFLKSEGLFFEL